MLGAEELWGRHGGPRGHGLHHGAPVPFQHLPGRGLHPARRSQSQVPKARRTRWLNLFSFIAEEVREILSSLGPEIPERRLSVAPDLLRQVSRGQPRSRRPRPEPDPRPGRCRQSSPRFCAIEGRNEVPDGLDAQMIQERQAGARGRRENAARLQCQKRAPRGRHTSFRPHHAPLRHEHAVAGADHRASSEARPASPSARSPVQGLRLEVFGDANDYVGKGLSGGTVVVRPDGLEPAHRRRQHHHRQYLFVRGHRW